MGVGGETDLLNPVPKKRKSKHLYGQLGPPRQYPKNFCVSQFIPSFSMSGGVFCHVICTEGALRRPMIIDKFSIYDLTRSVRLRWYFDSVLHSSLDDRVIVCFAIK